MNEEFKDIPIAWINFKDYLDKEIVFLKEFIKYDPARMVYYDTLGNFRTKETILNSGLTPAIKK